MSQGQGESPIPPQPKSEGVISIVVRDQSGTDVMFKVKKTTKLSKVMDAYVTKKNLDPSRIRFLLDGNRIMEDDTPERLGIEEGEQIDCVQTQIGGSGVL